MGITAPMLVTSCADVLPQGTCASSHTSTPLQFSLGHDTVFNPSSPIRPVAGIAQINRLPPELLGEIFTCLLSFFCSSAYETKEHTWLCFSQSIQVSLALSHVCRHWRAVALTLPQLWSSISAASHPLAIFMRLGRSRDIPLDLCTQLPPDQAIWHALHTDGYRIRSLYGHTTRIEDDNSVLSCLQFPAERLEVLVLKLSHINPSVPTKVTQPVLFQDHAPLLRTLILQSVPWLPANRFSTLTCLSITHQFVGTLGSLFEFLSGTPNLEDLTLVYLLRRRGADADLPVVNFPRLRRLTIGDVPAAFASNFLSSARLPTSMALYLFDIERRPISDLAFLRSEWMSALPLLAGLTRLSLAITDADGIIAFSVTAASSSSAFRVDWQVEPSLAVAQRRNGWVESLLSLLPAACITELWMDRWQFRDNDLEPLFRGLPSLNSVVINDACNNVEPCVFQLLAAPVDVSLSPLCPHLSTIRLIDRPSHPDALVYTLESRRLHGYPVQQLLIGTPLNTSQRALLEIRSPPSIKISRAGASPSMTLPDICFADKGHVYWPWSIR
ncbi:uncharacterized protein LAESUDRAFT_748615 [Laetiporus sulphureus 93-53]|uniref:Uncharacterized protein n=1 Tax=Laetiporus sulphureus 93-53 TaxID=1314785 RepID=A0A165FI89_9APHY|nr:uncharacterized protein LAESUDRAFT_748615 [Laetiporus sulphureus 93-53]KZT09010.1 hypothetical protein LAESUDRAFT_748615 [Laetiporus sulphureus 93-53]